MNPFKIEFNETAYRIDLYTYLIAPAVAAGLIIHYGDSGQWPTTLLALGAGLVTWTLLEYLVHRFILHGVLPFKAWHDRHHEQPKAEIGTPTLISLLVMIIGVFLPAIMVAGLKPGGGFALGILTGYAIYGWMHHGEHHWRLRHTWFRRLKRQHAIHHHNDHNSNYGVSTRFWDRIFGTYTE